MCFEDKDTCNGECQFEGDLYQQMLCLSRKKARDEQKERDRETDVNSATIRPSQMMNPTYRSGGRVGIPRSPHQSPPNSPGMGMVASNVPGGSERQAGRRLVDADVERRELGFGNQDRIDGKEYGKTDECVVCMDERRQVVFLPCRHMATCQKCAEKIVGGWAPICPICRGEVDETVKVFR